MAAQALKMQQALGLVRNPPEAEGPLAPRGLFNLTNVRRGGYTPLGVKNATPTAVLGGRNLLGADLVGLSSFVDAGVYSLFDGSVLTDQASAAYGATANTAHVPRLGAYRKRDQFLVRDFQGNTLEPLSYAPTITAAAEAAPVVKEVNTGTVFNDIGFDSSTKRWAAVGNGGVIYTSDDDGDTWTARTSGVGANLQAVDHNGSLWVAVGSGGTVITSTDAITWTTRNSGTTNFLADVEGISGLWVAVGGSIIITSPDGITWTTRDTAATYEEVAYDASLDMWIVTVSGVSAPFNTADFRRSLDGGVTWTAHNTGQFTNYFGIASNNQGLFVAVGDQGADNDLDFTATTDGANYQEVTVPTTILTSANVQRRIKWSGSAFVSVGDANGVIKSFDGFTWAKVTTGAAGTVNWLGLAVGDDGKVIAVGDDGSMVLIQAGSALAAGDYELAWLAYVATDAGKLVVNLGRQEFSFLGDEGNSVTVTAPANATPNLYVEVFLRFAPRGVDDVTGDVTVEELAGRDLILVDTIKPGDPALKVTVPKLGAILGLEGAVGTMAAGSAWAALHGNRVFLPLSGDSTEYTFLKDDIDVGDLSAALSLGYTELKYANLVAVDNYLPMPATQSTTLTGAISTPSGLLVFGDQETFLVAGDPALGGFQVELYPDIVGCDAGVTPTKLGGVAFTIWNGRVYALDGAQAADVSEPVFLPSDPFVRIVADPAHRALVGQLQSGAVLRFNIDGGFWFEDAVQTVTGVLPHPAGPRYLIDNAGSDEAFTLLETGTPATPTIDFVGVDFGDAQRRDTLQAVRFTVTGYTVNTGNPPELFYSVAATDPAITTEDASVRVVGRQFDEEVVFKLPWGLKARRADFRVKWQELPFGAVIEPGATIEFVPGHQADNAP